MSHIDKKETPSLASWLLLLYFLLWVIVGLIPTQLIALYSVLPFFGGEIDVVESVIADPEIAKKYAFGLTLFQGLSNFLGFVLVPWLFLKAVEKRDFESLSLDTGFNLQKYGLTFLVVILGMPLMSFLVEWNENVHLPMQWHELEAWAREREEFLSGFTHAMTDFSHPSQFIIAFVVIALIAGVWEELVFRGMIQRYLMAWIGNPHVAIALTGVVFSALHMQFFGFVPRMLLGILFGYLYYWSKDLSVSIFAHAVNNGVTVLLLYFAQQGYVEFDLENTESLPWQSIIVSTGLLMLVIYRFWKKCFVKIT